MKNQTGIFRKFFDGIFETILVCELQDQVCNLSYQGKYDILDILDNEYPNIILYFFDYLSDQLI